MKNGQKHGDAERMPGTKPSLHSGQTIVSSGIPSLDHVIDGGIPLGSLVVIDEDLYGDYARLMLSYFMSEAVCNHQPMLVASLDADPRKMTEELPAPADAASAPAPATVPSDQKMSIAWRYQALPQAPAPIAGRFGQHYDLGRYIEGPVLEAAPVSTWGADDALQTPAAAHDVSGVCVSGPLRSLLVRCERLLSSAADPPSVHRLAVHALGSPLWDCEPGHVIAALQLLRALLRLTSSVAMVTVPTHLWREDTHVHRLRRAADICIGLQSFQGTPAASSSAFSDYHGLVRLHRLSARNLLAARYPRSADLVFKVRRKKFSVETLHLPPELGETASRPQEEGETRSRPGALCQPGRSGTGAASIDF